MMGGYSQGWNGWMIAVMLLWPIAIGGAVWALAALTHSTAAGMRETPQQILDGRLAAGEIDPVDYDRKRALLDNGDMTGPTATGTR